MSHAHEALEPHGSPALRVTTDAIPISISEHYALNHLGSVIDTRNGEEVASIADLLSPFGDDLAAPIYAELERMSPIDEAMTLDGLGIDGDALAAAMARAA